LVAPIGALAGKVTVPAWKSKPSFDLVASDDRMIPPPAQRAMAQRAGAKVTETSGSHAVYVSEPAEIARVNKQAAEVCRSRVILIAGGWPSLVTGRSNVRNECGMRTLASGLS
jgi:Alpha/beta hydrolase family